MNKFLLSFPNPLIIAFHHLEQKPPAAHQRPTSGKSIGPPEAATLGPPSFCPLGQHWQNLPTIRWWATGGMLSGGN